MEESMVLKDPEKIRVSLEPLNRKILDLLMDREMTITMLANSIKDKGRKGVPAPTILRRVRKLLEAGLIEQTRVGTPPKSKAKNLLEKFYRTKARKFLIDTEISKVKGKEKPIELKPLEDALPVIELYGYGVPDQRKREFTTKLTELQNLLEEKSQTLTTRRLSTQALENVDPRTDQSVFRLLLSLEEAKDERIRKLLDEINRNLE
nr:winged helix-turn-helix domain-containing protein [Candidatus Njordarchaeum guaymaensis]